MITLCIQGGKKDKLRPGDLLGALTGDGGLTFEQVGKINVTEFNTTSRWTAASPSRRSRACPTAPSRASASACATWKSCKRWLIHRRMLDGFARVLP